MKTKLQVLADTLNDQVLAVEQTLRAIRVETKDTESHDLKNLVLTRMTTGHFGTNGLQKDAEDLVEKANELAKKTSKNNK